MAAFVLSSILELSDCMNIKSLIQQIESYKVDYVSNKNQICTRLVRNISNWNRKKEENVDLNNKRTHYLKIDRDTASYKINVLLDDVESDEDNNIGNLLNNPDTKFLLIKNLENDKVPADEQSNNVLILEANVHLVEDVKSEVNHEVNAVEAEHEIIEKEKSKEKEKAKKQKYMKCKWNRRSAQN